MSSNPDMLVTCVYLEQCLTILAKFKGMSFMPKAWLAATCVGPGMYGEVGDDARYTATTHNQQRQH